jgi:hypothetical protein
MTWTKPSGRFEFRILLFVLAFLLVSCGRSRLTGDAGDDLDVIEEDDPATEDHQDLEEIEDPAIDMDEEDDPDVSDTMSVDDTVPVAGSLLTFLTTFSNHSSQPKALVEDLGWGWLRYSGLFSRPCPDLNLL